MAEMLSPGVYVDEKDMSEIVPVVSSTVAVLGGMFTRGPIDDYSLISTVAQYEDIYGLPKNDNYNEWYQGYNFLQYGNHLLVSRAGNMNGAPKDTDLKVETITSESGYGIQPYGLSQFGIGTDDEIVVIDKKTTLNVGDIISFAPDKNTAIDQPRYIITGIIDTIINNAPLYALVLNKPVNFTIATTSGGTSSYSFNTPYPVGIVSTNAINPLCKIFKITELFNGSCEALAYDFNNFTITDSVNNGVTTLRNADTIDNLLDSNGDYIRIPLYLRTDITDAECNAHKLPSEANYPLRKIRYLAKSMVDMYDLFNTNKQIKNDSEFTYKLENKQFSFAFPAQSKLKFFSRNPGTDMARYKIVIANPRDFKKNYGPDEDGFIARYVSDGIPLDNVFDYPPETHTHQMAVVVYDPVNDEVVEKFVCSLDKDEVDSNNNSMYIENVINRRSSKIFAIVNESIPLHEIDVIDDYPDVASYVLYDNVIKIVRFTDLSDTSKYIEIAVNKYNLDSVNNEIDFTVTTANDLKGTQYETWTNCVDEHGLTWADITGSSVTAPAQSTAYTISLDNYTCRTQTIHSYKGRTLTLWNATDSSIQTDDLINAYNVFSNKDDLDIDIIIANERDDGYSAILLANARADCVAYIGARYEDCVGQTSPNATKALIGYRKGNGMVSGRGVGSTESLSNMFCALFGNYKYQYDRYNDTYRWVNFAGDVAGLRAQTNAELDPWWASAGLNRGQLKNVTKLAFNPNQSQRDDLYKNNVNIICSFPSQGVVLWGQKTLLDKASSFDRLNIRHLFNHIERALAKMSKYQVFEFNDSFTRNRILSIINPYLANVQAGRGIQDYYTVCDETNNTPYVISQNQMIVDIYIKPTYVAEFIKLSFINAGTNSFTTVVSGG